jgi:hypothetical protein
MPEMAVFCENQAIVLGKPLIFMAIYAKILTNKFDINV